MTTTQTPAPTATAATLVRVGSGRSVHYGFGNPGQLWTRCGAEGRGYRQSVVRVAAGATAATCRSCSAAAREAGETVVAAPAAPVVDLEARRVEAIELAAKRLAQYAGWLAQNPTDAELVASVARYAAKLAELTA